LEYWNTGKLIQPQHITDETRDDKEGNEQMERAKTGSVLQNMSNRHHEDNWQVDHVSCVDPITRFHMKYLKQVLLVKKLGLKARD